MVKEVDVTKLQEGMCVADPIYSSLNGQMLVDGDSLLTTVIIKTLIKHKVGSVFIITDGDPSSESFDEKLQAFKNNVIEEDGEQRLKIDSRKAREAHSEAIERTTSIFAGLKSTDKVDVEELKSTAGDLVVEVLNNPQAFAYLNIMKTKDSYLYVHSVDVGILSIIFGKALELSYDELKELTMAALLHDTGKLFLSPTLLYKEAAYTDEEIEQIKQHTQKGYDTLIKQGIGKKMARPALEHHEWIDGSGYPSAMTGAQISRFSRIISICNVYNNLTMPGGRQGSIAPYKAVHIITSEVGRHFDSELTKIFLRVVGVYPNGTMSLLSNNSICRVVDQNVDSPLRPVLQLVSDADGKRIDEIELIDLAVEKDYYIKEVIFEEV